MRASFLTARNRWATGGASVLVVAAGLGVLSAPVARAHSPHDVVLDVELSPEFGRDETAYAIVREHLLRSDDGGDT